jgi:hypothetical protein
MSTGPKTYEMLWDCRYCGTRGLLGLTHRFCPSCGAPQDPSARYFPDEAHKVALEDHVYVGVDRRCPACETPNSAKSAFCRSCGGPLTDAAAVATRQDQLRAIGGGPADGAGARGWRSVGADEGDDAAGRASRRPGRRRPRAFWVVGGLALGVIVVLVLMQVWTRSTFVEVVGHTWEREVAIDRYGPLQRSAWCDSLPVDAQVIDRFQAPRGTRQVPDGEDCALRRQDQGDGTYRETMECRPRYRAEPVMDRRCTYRVYRWTTVRTATASGNGFDPPPHWPQPTLAGQGQCDGCERLGARSARYLVALRGVESGKVHQCRVSEPRWRALRLGTRYKADVGAITDALNCDSLRAIPPERTMP